MSYENGSNRDRFLPVAKAVEAVTGRRVNPSTIWRWIRRGVAGQNGERIRLETWPMGRTVLTTEDAVWQFIEAQKQAKKANLHKADDATTVEELQRRGLLPKSLPDTSGKSNRKEWRRE